MPCIVTYYMHVYTWASIHTHINRLGGRYNKIPIEIFLYTWEYEWPYLNFIVYVFTNHICIFFRSLD